MAPAADDARTGKRGARSDRESRGSGTKGAGPMRLFDIKVVGVLTEAGHADFLNLENKAAAEKINAMLQERGLTVASSNYASDGQYDDRIYSRIVLKDGTGNEVAEGMSKSTMPSNTPAHDEEGIRLAYRAAIADLLVPGNQPRP